MSWSMCLRRRRANCWFKPYPSLWFVGGPLQDDSLNATNRLSSEMVG
ncbi:MAG TPA: hypothetical protein VEK07_14300 [Polyangiaceae bacterium]|nr:hypothetical protein [Polyangiaceae bacterium]